MRRADLLAALAALAVAPAARASPPAPTADPAATRITGAESYLPTFGLRASISRGYRVHGVLAVDAGLDIPDAKQRKKAEGVKPRLVSVMRDAVLNYATLSYVVGERPDADMLRARIQKPIDAMLGKDVAKVLLASVIVFKQ
ncbi:MAG: hypothetical protein R3C52_09740 [Hyphomonadaceae bacterium]